MRFPAGKARIRAFDNAHLLVTVAAVHSLKQFIALALVALWLPVTMHCTLETLPGLGFLQTCCGDEALPSASDCQDDHCAAVESGLYKTEQRLSLAPAPIVWAALAAWVWLVAPAPDPFSDLGPAPSPPPELLSTWQFSRRTALPPRAPSLVA